MLTTVITIGGITYDATDRAANGFVGIDALTLSTDNHDELEFTILGCGPQHPFVPGQEVTLTTLDGDAAEATPGYYPTDYFPATYYPGDYFGAPGGSGPAPRLRFRGDIVGPVLAAPSRTGWQFSYRATGLKRRADYITLRATDGSAVASYNLPLDDDDYLDSTSGRTVGQIVTAILASPYNAAALDAAGIGAYVALGPPATLHPLTVADLAALTIVPNVDVRLEGEAILSALDQFIRSWHAQYCLWVRPDGVIRIASPFDFPAHALAVPGAADADADPVDWPQYSVDASECFTRYEIVGRDIRGVVLSTRDGTLQRATTTAQLSAWTLDDFLNPKGSVDAGTLSGLTSTSATVHSDYAAAHWDVNYWSGGRVIFYDLASAGIAQTEEKPITAATALSPGGSATISWDPSIPLSSSSYTRYRLINANTPLAEVDRLFDVREPSGGALGLATWVGSHLAARFNRLGFQWGNNSLGSSRPIYYPAAQVLWSPTGAYPWFSEPVPIQGLVRDSGRVNLRKPAVTVSADLANNVGGLATGYPSTFAAGKYYDLQVAVPYNRGDLHAHAPAPGAGAGGSDYQGTAYTKYGITRAKIIPLDSWNWEGDQASMEKLAAERLRTMCDASIEGSIGMHYDAWTPTFDVFTLGYALTLGVGGAASPLDGESLPVRAVVFRWPNDGADIHTVSFRFSNKKAPFAGDSLYLHPSQFPPATFGTQEGTVFIAGQVGGQAGEVDQRAFFGGFIADDEPSGGDSPAGAGGAADQLVRQPFEGGPEDFEGGDGPEPGADADPGMGQMGMGEDWGLGRSGKHLSRPSASSPANDPAPPPPDPGPASQPAASPRPGSLAERRGVTPAAPADDSPTARSIPQPDPPPAPPRRMTLRERRGLADDTQDGGG